MQKEIDEALDGLFEKEERFMSHVTIARVKNTADKKKLIEYVPHGLNEEVFTPLDKKDKELKRKLDYSLLSVGDFLKQLKGKIIYIGDGIKIFKEDMPVFGTKFLSN